MKYCPDCGIAVRGEHRFCPLCGTLLGETPSSQPEDALPREALLFAGIEMRIRSRPLLVPLVSLAIIAVPALVCAIVDILVSGGVTWSAVVFAALGLAWSFISLPGLVLASRVNGSTNGYTPKLSRRHRRRRFWILMLLNFTGIWGFLLFVDARSGALGLQWALDFGGLICLLCFALFLFGFYSLQPPFAGRRAWLLFIWISLFCLALDFSIVKFIIGEGGLSWGLVVSASLIPVAVLYAGLVFFWRRNSHARRRLHI